MDEMRAWFRRLFRADRTITITSHPLTPEASEAFDKAFAHLDSAFAEMDRAFAHLKGPDHG